MCGARSVCAGAGRALRWACAGAARVLQPGLPGSGQQEILRLALVSIVPGGGAWGERAGARSASGRGRAGSGGGAAAISWGASGLRHLCRPVMGLGERGRRACGSWRGGPGTARKPRIDPARARRRPTSCVNGPGLTCCVRCSPRSPPLAASASTDANAICDLTDALSTCLPNEPHAKYILLLNIFIIDTSEVCQFPLVPYVC
ncbi:hypothetical protein O0L34_g11154 [Tuta absoluta]|nr:hypothetical protein O0L34_g2089 [Tuta absoluta]KAJ2949840.1 hypothetical protein O0L34_g11154 [Tuta absoluta]